MTDAHLSERLLRIERLLGKEKVTRLIQRRVAVIGLGAVGSYATEALARSGVGQLVLVDFDQVNASNINRQLYALTSTLGQPKAAVAELRVRDINPGCEVTAREVFVHDDTLPALGLEVCDLVLDCIDSLTPKAALLAYCLTHQIPVISSMGAALRTDPLQVRLGDLTSVTRCPLARKLRKRLRRQGLEPVISCVYSDEPVDFEYTPPDAGPTLRGRPRRVLGSLPTLTGIFGLTLANAAIKQLVADPSQR